MIECLNHIFLLDYVALITIFDQGPCGTFQIMKDHYNDIELYTPLTVHAIYINSNSDLSKKKPFLVVLFKL